MKLRWTAFVFVLAVLLTAGCSRQQTYDRFLVEADSLVEQHADSVRQLLEGMAEILDEGDEGSRAYYTLLLTQARYMCYKATPSDSLIDACVRYYEESGDQKMLCRAYYYRAMTRYEEGKHEDALLLLKKGEEIATHHHDILYMSKYHESLCMVNGDAKYYDMALRYAKLALADNRTLRDTSSIIRNLSQISTMCYRLGRVEESRDIILSVLPFLDKMAPVERSYTLTNIGCTMHSVGDMESARHYLNESLRINPMANTYCELGDICAEDGDMAEAEKNWNKAMAKATETNDNQIILNVLSSWSYMYAVRGDYEKALDISERFYQMKDSLNRISEQATLAEIQHKYDRQVVENKYYKVLAWSMTGAFAALIMIVLLTIIINGLSRDTTVDFTRAD